MKLCIPFLFVLFGCSCSHSVKVLDSQSAILANDLTAILSGCGQQLAGSGYLVCRETELQNTRNEFLIVHTPPGLDCKQEACTFVKVFFSDGRPSLEKAIHKGDALIQIPWSEIVGKKVFDLSDRGTYSISIRTHYLGPDGIERIAFAEGRILMLVVRKEYTSLIENEDDEAFYWIWKTKQNQTLKVTTGYRVYIQPWATPWNPLGTKPPNEFSDLW